MKKNQKQICGKLDQDQQGSTMIDQNWRIIIGRYISWGGGLLKVSINFFLQDAQNDKKCLLQMNY